MKTIIPNIIPFAQFFYKDCYYNSLFAILCKYMQNPFSIVANETPIFTTCENNLLGAEIQYIARLPEAIVLANCNIESCATYKATHFVDDIIGSLIQGKPVILFVDCFFEPIRKDMYKQEHLDHSLLVYGYDDEREVFQVFEHNNRFSLNYVSTELSFADAYIASKGYVANYGGPDKPLWIDFVSQSYLPPVDERNIAIEYINNVKWHAARHPTEEATIQTLFASLMEYMEKPFLSEEVGQLLTEELTRIINARNAELLCIQSLDSIIVTLLQKIVDAWTTIRLSILTLVYGENISDAKKHYFMNVLNELRSMEMSRISMLLKE